MSELWLKNKKVLTFEEKEGVVTSIKKIEDRQLLPLSLYNECTVDKLNEWFKQRTIPKNREYLNEATAAFGTKWLTPKNYQSLSDQYWIKNMLEEWKKINYFTNRYSTDIGDIFFEPWGVKKIRLNNNSPDLTTNGVLKKRWIQDKKTKKSYLLKAGSKITNQEPLSEIMVSVLLEQLQIMPFVRYDFCIEGTTLCSKCENFVTANTELVPLSYIYHLKPRKYNSIYDHILRMCDEFEVPNMPDFIEAMIFIDSVTGNDDRNLGNIGLLRDADTLKFIGPAPLFDFGAAYWSNGIIRKATSNARFADVEKKILKKMEHRCDIESIIKNENILHCIEMYPNIGSEKKKELISAIKDRNQVLFTSKEELDYSR